MVKLWFARQWVVSNSKAKIPSLTDVTKTQIILRFDRISARGSAVLVTNGNAHATCVKAFLLGLFPLIVSLGQLTKRLTTS